MKKECGYDTTIVSENKYNSWWLIFLAGFVGGLLAFLTPCVFPMVPLTVSYFTKRSGTRAKGIRNAIYYGLSIIVIYLILGLVITSIFGADALNQLSTNAWFNLFFAVLFIIFGISFFGFFEITLPSSWANKSDSMASKGGLLGIFFMAFTLALVSFSCTGPIIGTLLVQTATGDGPTILGSIPAGPLFGMLGFSTALALPFALFAMFPAWLNSLPKSGSWMNVIKVTLGFIEIALALKFISIADLTMGWKIMPYELFVGLWILVALAMTAYYFGWLRFPLDPPNQKISKTRKILGTITLIFALYFVSGFKVNKMSETFMTPNMLSGLAPPPGHSYILPKHCPLTFNCFHDFDKGLEYAKEVNKPILLDFTGYGCVNCRRMEDNVWSKDEVYNIIENDYVLISLYVDERKELEETYFSTFSNKEIKETGKKWADFQAIHFNTNSQPYYVLLSPDNVVLNKPVAYTPDLEQYKQFLLCGLERFKELEGEK
ncbi:MAG: cytochrome c biogenesis protein CcdA [Saprospiraceae bacterium]